MELNIVNIADDFLKYWEDNKNLSIKDKKKKFKNYYYNNNKEILDVYFSNWGDFNYLNSAIKRYDDVVNNINDGLNNIEQRIKNIIQNEKGIFEIDNDDMELNIILMVGLFTSNGWVTKFKSKDTIFLALELFNENKYIDLLIAHELAHAFYHSQSILDKDCDSIALSTFDEGLATLVTKKLYPKITEIDLLWFGLRLIDLDKWKRNVDSNINQIKDYIIEVLSKNDNSTYKDFFSTNKNSKPYLPIRTGYLIGLRSLIILNQKYKICDMIKWNESQIFNSIKSAIKKI